MKKSTKLFESLQRAERLIGRSEDQYQKCFFLLGFTLTFVFIAQGNPQKLKLLLL